MAPPLASRRRNIVHPQRNTSMASTALRRSHLRCLVSLRLAEHRIGPCEEGIERGKVRANRFGGENEGPADDVRVRGRDALGWVCCKLENRDLWHTFSGLGGASAACSTVEPKDSIGRNCFDCLKVDGVNMRGPLI